MGKVRGLVATGAVATCLSVAAPVALATPAALASRAPERSSTITTLYASHVRHLNTCRRTGLSGPTGAIQLYVYGLPGSHPSPSSVTCRSVIPVGRAGKRFMFAQLSRSYGTTFEVAHTTYRVDLFVFVGASGPSPGFAGGGIVVAAQYPSGR